MNQPFYYNYNFLKEVLALHKLKIKDFALSCNLEGSTISRIIHGSYNPSIKTTAFDKIENALKKLKVPNIEDFYQPEKTFVMEAKESGNQMITDYWKIHGEPFPALANDAALWRNDEVKTILERINNAVYNHEFLSITGEVGSGKSTLFRTAYRQLSDDPNVIISTVPSFHSKHLTDSYLCDIIIEDLGKQKIPIGVRKKAIALNNVLDDLANRNINPVLMFDEAQMISDETLKDIRLIAEEWKSNGNPIAFILFAKPELKLRLRKGSMKEVAKRLPIIDITGFHAAVKADVRDYITFKLKAVGGNIDTIFSPEAIQFIADRSRTPLDVNMLSRAGMIAAARIGDDQVNKDHIIAGISE
jgi:type II secretory pathway predicted ATPase ExeA